MARLIFFRFYPRYSIFGKYFERWIFETPLPPPLPRQGPLVGKMDMIPINSYRFFQTVTSNHRNKSLQNIILKLTQGLNYFASHLYIVNQIYKMWETVNKTNKNATQNSSNIKKNQKVDFTGKMLKTYFYDNSSFLCKN